MIVPLMNKYVADLDSTVGKDGIFSTDYVKRVKTASKLILSGISSATGVKACEGSLRSMNLNKSSITKAQLCSWLETTVYLLGSCSLPLLDFATIDLEELDFLKAT